MKKVASEMLGEASSNLAAGIFPQHFINDFRDVLRSDGGIAYWW